MQQPDWNQEAAVITSKTFLIAIPEYRFRKKITLMEVLELHFHTAES